MLHIDFVLFVLDKLGLHGMWKRFQVKSHYLTFSLVFLFKNYVNTPTLGVRTLCICVNDIDTL